ncbi:hypothetical protein [Flavobacterium psychrophilum]|uniref:hypothetical protein n=1 Tax=Flavobacterium psychrophilum TaxID=96345 RepID=UPI001D05F720|nr:hypothetical protein [Flavobacterium psychrophilum]EKT4518811.1 hypothetical protein [Flavobacterium psychrophilum]MCB6097249.1 hypothetical protein [Flavobacterium psychrophilum]
MNSFWKLIIAQTILKYKNKKSVAKKEYSNFVLAKGYREFLIHVKRLLKDLILVTIGVFSASFEFKGFLLTNHFIDGAIINGTEVLTIYLSRKFGTYNSY